jgi:hypothetical protein
VAEKSRPNKERSKRFLESCHVLTKEPWLKSSLTGCGCCTRIPCSRQQPRSGQMTRRLDDRGTKKGSPASGRLCIWCGYRVWISGPLPGEALSYFALLLTFQAAARHLVCGPLQAVVFPGCLCWFVLRVRRRGGSGVLLGGFHLIHLSFW